MYLSRSVGVYCPDDLAILKRVFVQICSQRSIVPADDKLSAEHLAAQLVALSNNGVSDEAGLLRALNERDIGELRRCA